MTGCGFSRRARFLVRAAAASACALLLTAGLGAPAPAASSGAIIQYEIPTVGSSPSGISLGPDGSVCFAERAGSLAWVDRDGGIREERAPSDVGPTNVCVGRAGAWYTVSERDQVGFYGTGGANGFLFTRATPGGSPWDIVEAPDGKVWFTEREAGALACVSGDRIAEFPIPTPGCDPYGIALAPDGSVWFTEREANRIGSFHPDTGRFAEFKVPTAASRPTGIAAGPDGDMWFTEYEGDRIGRCSPSGDIREYRLPGAGRGPLDIAVGPDGNLWFTEAEGDRVALCTASGSIREYSLPAGSRPEGIASGYQSDVWFTEPGTNRVGRMKAGRPTWYLAEGSTAWGFSTYLSIANPDPSPVRAQVTYQTDEGPVAGPFLELPPGSQTTVNPRDTLGERDFSAKVRCLDPRATIAVDRTMTWTGPGARGPETHCSIGAAAPSPTWYFAEGCSAWGFESWLCVQNTSARPAALAITYMIEGGRPVTVKRRVAAGSRSSFSMGEDIGPANASMKVTSDVPVIAERSMYRDDRREGHNSIGVTAPSVDNYLAEGSTAAGFTTYLTVQNPGDTDDYAYITYLTTEGERREPPVKVAANSRLTVRVNDSLPGKDFAVQVRGGLHFPRPVVVERSMLWDGGTGEACHDSIGVPSPHRDFYLPDGQSSGGRETWTLVANPGFGAVEVEVTYLTRVGPTGRFTDLVPPRSRRSYNMADRFPSGRAAVRVRCMTPGGAVVCERSMYLAGRSGGSCTVGAFED